MLELLICGLDFSKLSCLPDNGKHNLNMFGLALIRQTATPSVRIKLTHSGANPSMQVVLARVN
jgi:hypothetical protein